MMQSINREFKFLRALWQANLLAAMEYRVAFLSQVVGMMLNNALYFIFWVLFFERFEEVRGWALNDMLLLFAVVATGFGAAVVLFGNVVSLTEVIANGRLDYYLSLPRPAYAGQRQHSFRHGGLYLWHRLFSGRGAVGLGHLVALSVGGNSGGFALLRADGDCPQRGFLVGQRRSVGAAGFQRRAYLLDVPDYDVRWCGKVLALYAAAGRVHWSRANRLCTHFFMDHAGTNVAGDGHLSDIGASNLPPRFGAL
jgi:hypothetical protein